METLTNCPVCKHNSFKEYLSCIDYTVSRETFHIVKCETCGFRFTNPRPDETEIGKYYESEEYISHSGTNKGIVNKLYQTVRNHTIKQKVKLINKLASRQHPAARNILDVGAGTGAFLNACKKNGWDVNGIEPSSTARENAKKNFGITFYPSLQTLVLKGGNGGMLFNVITMWHVLEHVHHLDKTIQDIKNLLADDGTLIIAVPNCNSYDAEKYGAQWAAWDLPRHLYHFTKKDVEKLFSGFDFMLAEVLPMKYDSYYASLVSEKYKTGNFNLLARMGSLGAGFLRGLKSNLSAKTKDKGYSSQIYILKKNHI